MIRNLDPEDFLREGQTSPVIDVRSPGEFSQGHIPGAISLPLFSDEERAVVGTLYHRSGRETAILKGLEFANPKKKHFISVARSVSKGKAVLVHCWRGGMRSEQMARLFSENDMNPAVLTGGYKAYRKHVRTALSDPATIFVLGGYTGSGKTEILRQIGNMGCQVLDLEKLASHKGSAFGGLGQGPQPTNEQFENDLYTEWCKFDLSKPVWLEDESRMLGKVTLPEPVFEKITGGTLLFLDVSREQRVRRLVAEYAGFDKALLGEAVEKISERLGIPRTREALQAIAQGALPAVAENILSYYDKAYRHSIERNPYRKRLNIEFLGGPAKQAAEKLVAATKERIGNEDDLS